MEDVEDRMSLWYYATALANGPGPQASTVLSPANITAWETQMRSAITTQGNRVLADWAQYRDTNVWPNAGGSGINMYDGLRSFLQAYFYFGCTDSVYLDYAHATANFYWKWMEQGGLTTSNPQNFYKPQTVLFYPDGMASLFKLDPTFNGGPNDPNLWNSGVAKNIPQFFEQVVNNCQYGESAPSGTITDRETLSREVALTVMYYLDSLRVGNTLPAPARFDKLVTDMKTHMRQWLDDGPTLVGVSTLDYAAHWNFNNIPATETEITDPALQNLSTWMMGITAEAMIRTYREHPSYNTDTSLIEPMNKLADWLITYGREPERVGTYWSRYVECHDCNDPIVQAANSPFSPVCVDNPNKTCWHISVPYSQNPSLAGDKAYEILTAMVWPPLVYMFDKTQNPIYSREIDDVFNLLIENYDMGGHMAFGPGKQLNQSLRWWFDVLRVRNNSSIYTTFHDGALPCT